MDKRINKLNSNLSATIKSALSRAGVDINTPAGRLAAVEKYSINFKDGDDLNEDIRKWNDKYRGRYMTVESRGFKVKVPYYQLPLIFGDCFGYYSGDGQPNGAAVDSVNGFKLDSKKRAFDTSLRTTSSSRLGDRWGAQVSNLMFFRLSNTAPLDGVPFKHSTKNRYATYKNYWKGSEYNGLRYISERGPLSTNMLNELTSMPVYVYRVNAYEISSGQYFYDANAEPNKGNGVKAFYYDPRTASDNKSKYPLQWLQDSMVGRPEVVCDGDSEDADNAEDINAGVDVDEEGNPIEK